MSGVSTCRHPFLGRRRPVLVHLPIGGLVLLGLFELVSSRSASTAPINKVPLDRPVFAAVVEPILQQRCVACHGPEKHKADLRLDTLEALLKGSQNGPVLKAGHAEESSLLQRILLPLDHDGHMPPESEPQPTAPEMRLLEWWINALAPTNVKIADCKPAPTARIY